MDFRVKTPSLGEAASGVDFGVKVPVLGVEFGAKPLSLGF